ncbi:hypothetical protein Pla175_07430 [Pirellulimonas nuda]|uniref:3-keto-alpha-glucoside-1,2-lyase/3-keto-2-hydroxy-glucal hydratase domain-containing protein n=1 Tax=Pirellulimonas nuda TaxID=2528009 RepID=A0A518D7C2_9BACT|nr:DUF1080 domain-containing protein [Pirellulimonas nuda]QDU87384.1 hypothetical protein Pla175_07430 [Pirellulimonas nuda]
MPRFLLPTLALTFVLVPFALAQPATDAAPAATQAGDDGLKPLISPKDFHADHFHGWTQRGGKATYHVEGDEIVGTSVPNTPNSFLCSNKLYDDFVLEFDVKIDSGLNSGVQIRSECFDEPTTSQGRKIPAGRVHGYQVEIDPTPRAYSGGIYDEARRGWLNDLKGPEHADARAAFKPAEWNHYRVVAKGDRLQTWINGVPAADLTDDVTGEGFIALQVHGIGDAAHAGKQVRWKNVKLKELGDE